MANFGDVAYWHNGRLLASEPSGGRSSRCVVKQVRLQSNDPSLSLSRKPHARWEQQQHPYPSCTCCCFELICCCHCMGHLEPFSLCFWAEHHCCKVASAYKLCCCAVHMIPRHAAVV